METIQLRVYLLETSSDFGLWQYMYIFTIYISLLWYIVWHIPYCPGKASISTCSSSTKKWGWAVAWRRCLNNSTILVQVATLDWKLADRATKLTCIPCASFFFFSQTKSARHGVSCIAWLVCANLATRCSGAWSSSEWSQLCMRAQQQYKLWTFESFSWWAVTRRTLKNHQNCQNWGVGGCAGMGVCLGQYGTASVVSLQPVVCWYADGTVTLAYFTVYAVVECMSINQCLHGQVGQRQG